MNRKDTTHTATGNHNDRGKRAEELAAGYLGLHGLIVLKRNFRCQGGEIDLVCRSGTTLVFAEVRLRGSPCFGGAGASITPAKQRRIVLAARHYLAMHEASDCDCRFDCILFDGSNDPERCRIEWIRDAFTAD